MKSLYEKDFSMQFDVVMAGFRTLLIQSQSLQV